MNDFELLAGKAGGLAETVDACSGLNDSLTRLLDLVFSPDDVDGFDASCNTCLNFQRKPMTPEEKKGRNVFGMPGICRLSGNSVTAWQRGQYDGFNHAHCYVNRRTGKRPNECCTAGDAHEGCVDAMRARDAVVAETLPAAIGREDTMRRGMGDE